MKTKLNGSVLLLAMLIVATTGCGKSSAPATDDKIKVEMKVIDDAGMGEVIGSIQLSDGSDGLMLKPDLAGLPPGSHGFHVHQNPDCGPSEKDGKLTAGNAAGEHYDPAGAGKHAGPEGTGHAGDLPPLVVSADGKASGAMTASRLKVADLKNRALMIHAEGDDFALAPGGARIACGVVS